MRLFSHAFTDNGAIPARYTCDGDDVSPPLEWTNVPGGAKTVALICDDPDAPKRDFTHWVLFDRPPSRTLPEHVAARPELPGGGRQGTNDFGKIGYGGPCPPSGTHHYRFTLYALDTELRLPPSSTTRKQVESAMKGHVLEAAQLTGVYSRAR